MFLKRARLDRPAREYTVCVRHGDVWTTEAWTADQWQAWLDGLSPRQLVAHMSHWNGYAQGMPALRAEFNAVVSDARRSLLRRECVLAAEQS